MSSYLILLLSIIFEVLGTMLLPMSQNFSKFFPTIILIFSYTVSIYLLSIISQKLPLSIIYSTWAGLGVFSVAILSYVIYNQKLAWQAVGGLFMIIIGVILVQIYKKV